MIKYLTAEDLQERTGMSKSFCYKLIRQLNAELKAKDYIVLPGHVPEIYFEERTYREREG